MARTLIIDGQMFQTGAWHRGMGQYMSHLLKELATLSIPEELYVVLNTNLPIEESRLVELKQLCPRLHQVKAALPLPEPGLVKSKNEAAYRHALERCVSSIVGGESKEVSYLITAPFMFDYFALFPTGCRKLLMFYDLTPLLHWRDLGGYFPPELYMQRFSQIFDADVVFAISKTTKDDLLDSFALEESKVVNIDGGFSGFDATAKKPRFAVPAKYVLFPTGDLPHKNNEVAVRGFNEFCTKTGWKGKMLITSTFSEEAKLNLNAESDRLIFTGNIPIEELRWLYEHTDAVIFSSKYEGLGIPLLDAVSNNIPALASRIPVFLEMTKDGYYYFDPSNPSELAGQLEHALTTDSFTIKQQHYPAIMKKYTWAETARKFVEGFETVNGLSQEKPAEKHQRIAIVSMHPGIASTIGRLSEKLYVQLCHEYDIDFYFDTNGAHPKDMERPTFLDQQDCRVFDISRLTLDTYKHYQKILYILDSRSLHRTAQRAAVLPGYLLYSSLKNTPELSTKIITENQHDIYQVGTRIDYKSLTAVCSWIQGVSPSEKLKDRVDILHSSAPHRSIMKRLMEKQQQ